MYVIGLIDARLEKIKAFMSILKGRVDDMDKSVEELKSKKDMKEFRVEMQAAVNSLVADFNKEIRAFRRAMVAAKDCELRACKTELKPIRQGLRFLRHKSRCARI